MSRKEAAAALALIALLGACCPAQAFLRNHPKARKLAKVAGIGVLTGGAGAVLMGGSVVGGAAVGAGSHVGFHELKEKWKERKQHRLD